MKTKAIILTLSAIMSLAGAPGALAADDAASRTAAAERYLRAVPMKTLMDEAVVEMAKQIPESRRREFIDQMGSLIRVKELERICREAMVKIFTVDELNALADFYSSRHGASAMKKFGPYMAEIMPFLMQETQRAVLELQTKNGARGE